MKAKFLGFSLLSVAVLLAWAGLPQVAAHAVDTTPPTGSVIINNNRSATNTPNVTLAIAWADNAGGSGVSRMRFSNDGAHWTVWEELAATRAYTLPGGDGHKTVRVQFLDKANNRSAAFSDYILLDTTAPTGAISINEGAQTAPAQAVTLGLTWSDGAGTGVTRMRFSDDGAHWTAWETPKATRAHTLPATLGYHTVRVQYLDGAGNYSAVFNDYIKLVGFSAGTSQTVMLPGNVPLEMMWIPGGTFQMGRYPDEQDSNESMDPQHSVTLAGYWMGKYEVTKAQWKAVMGTEPWAGKSYVLADLNSPAIYISWNSAQAFTTAASSSTGKAFRLPSESQWEYACRAGTTTRFYWSDDPGYSEILDYAWCDQNTLYAAEYYAHVVGQKTPNNFGLYDMSGNVWEWCQDWWHDNYVGAPADGSAWEVPAGTSRIIRGGAWDYNGLLTSDFRTYSNPAVSSYNSFGFRVVQIP